MKNKKAEEALRIAAANHVTEVHKKEAGDYWFEEDEKEMQAFIAGAGWQASKQGEAVMKMLNKKIDFLDKEMEYFEDKQDVVHVGGDKHLDFVRKHSMLSGLLIAKEIFEENIYSESTTPSAQGQETEGGEK